MDRLALPTQIGFPEPKEQKEQNDKIQHIKIMELWNLLLKINNRLHDDLNLQAGNGTLEFRPRSHDGSQTSFLTKIQGEFITTQTYTPVKSCYTYNPEVNVIYPDSHVNQDSPEYILSILGEYPDIIFYNCQRNLYLYLHNITGWDRHGAMLLTRCDEYLIEEKDVGILLKNLSLRNADNQYIAPYTELERVNSFDLSPRRFIATRVPKFRISLRRDVEE